MATETGSSVHLQKQMREIEMPAKEMRNSSTADRSKDYNPMPPNVGGRSISPARLSRARGPIACSKLVEAERQCNQVDTYA